MNKKIFLAVIFVFAFLPLTVLAAPAPPSFSHDGGFFASPFLLTITSEPGTTVRITTDGSIPTENSMLYSTPLWVHSPDATAANSPMSVQGVGRAYLDWQRGWTDNYIPRLYYNGMVVRARAFNASGASDVVTHSFFVENGGRGSFGTRVLSLVMEPAHFIHETQGMYRNWDSEQWWNQPDVDSNDGPRHIVNVEMFNPDGSLMYSQNARAWVFGNWSRRLPQRSFRINFNQGDGDLVGMTNMIPNSRKNFYNIGEFVQNYRHINARVADHDGTGIKECIVNYLSEPLRPTLQYSTYGAVFVNGEFWGMYALREHRHEHLIAEKYGVNRNSVEMSDSIWQLYYGYVHGNDMTAPNAFEELNKHIDLDNFIDYFIIGYHFENWDWLHNNFEFWRTTRNYPDVYGGDMRWRFIIQDFDGAVLHGANNMMNYFTALPGEYLPPGMPWDFAEPGMRISPDAATFIRELFRNEEFRNRFAARYSTYTGTAFHPSVANAILDDMVEERVPTIGAHLFRWSYHGATDPWDGVNSWINHGWYSSSIAGMRTVLNTRADHSIEHIRAYYNRADRIGLNIPANFTNINWTTNADMGFLDISGAQIRPDLYRDGFDTGNFSARYIRNLPIHVTAMPFDGFEFSHFEVSMQNTVIASSENTITIRPHAFALNMSVNAVFTARVAPPPPSVIINQYHGNGTPGENSISHGFIELYNPTDEDIYLGNYSLQIQNNGDNTPANLIAAEWDVLPLTGHTIKSRSSLLIVSTNWAKTQISNNHLPRYVISDWDIGWNIQFSNRNVSVAVVNNHEPLPAVISGNAWGRVIDLVGALNDPPPRDRVDNFFIAPASRISRQLAIRRNNFENTRDNAEDFQSIDYRYPTGYANRRTGVATSNVGITNLRLAELRPRYSGDGEWPPLATPHQINVIGGTGATATPNPAEEGRVVTLNAGAAPTALHRFSHWSTDAHGVKIENENSPTAAYFIMADSPVTVTANFFIPTLREPSVIIHQIHGNGSSGTNAISHGFIELFNPTGHAVYLGNYSLQISNGGAGGVGQWNVLNLSGRWIQAHSSFLIVSTSWFNVNNTPSAGHMPRYIIPDWDMPWNLQFSNNNISVAIVEGQEPLSGVITQSEWARIVDLAGALNELPPVNQIANFLGEAPAMRISRQVAARRINFQNTHDNFADFRAVDYRYPTGYANARPGPATSNAGITNAQLQELRPRYSGDGDWGAPGERFSVTVIGGQGSSGSGTYRAGSVVHVNAGTRPAPFDRWTRIEGISISNPLLPAFTFIMPENDVVLTASFRYADIFNRGIVFPNLLSSSPVNTPWGGGFNISHGEYMEFDPTRHGTHTLTLPPWQRTDTHWLENETKILYLEPTNAIGRPLLPIVLESISVNGVPRIVNQQFAAIGWFWNETPGVYFNDISLGHGGHGSASWNIPVPGFTTREFAIPDISDIITIHGDGWSPQAGTSQMLGIMNQNDIVSITIRVGNGGARNTVSLQNTGEGASGSGTYAVGEIVHIRAGTREGYVFDGWLELPHAEADRLNPNTSFTMPSTPLVLTATWKPATFLRGDVNGDGIIDDADITLLTRYLLATDKAAFTEANFRFRADNADISGNGAITTLDLTLLRHMLDKR
jgi:uncharacterized repeat protein (TIGR02543 family)